MTHPLSENATRQERFTFAFDHPAPGTAAAAVRATGTITCVAKASLVDTDYCTIGDGIQQPWVFEFDTSGNGASLQSEGTRASGTILCDTDANGGDGDTLTISDGINAPVVYEYDKSSNGVTAGRVQQAAGTTAASNATALKALIEANQPALTVTDDLAGTLTLTHKFPGVFANVTITETGTVYQTVTGMAGGVDAVAIGGVVHGRKQVDVSADVTAADVAARLRTAILAVMPSLSVTDNADGTLSLSNKVAGTAANVTITENVANAGFLVTGMSGGADADTTGATLAVKLFTAQRRFRVDKVEYVNPTGFVQDAANYWTIAIKKDATVMAQWSCLTGAEGTIAANTPVALTLSATALNQVADKDAVISLALTKVAGAANLPAGRIFVHGRYV